MIVPLAFWLFLLGAFTISWKAGDAHDRQVILAIGAAATLTLCAQVTLPFILWRIAVAAINISLLIIVWRYARYTDRYWPIWFAGFHSVATFIGIATLLMPPGQRSILSMAGGFWAIPALLAMTIGLLADQRRGISNTQT